MNNSIRVRQGARVLPSRTRGSAFSPAFGSAAPSGESVPADAAVSVDPAAGASQTPIDGAQIFTVGRSEFGLFTVQRGQLVAGADALVLPQPSAHRIFLTIVNIDPANSLTVNFANAGSAAQGFVLPPNFGAMTFDKRVPQDDIHLWSVGACLYQLMYSNRADLSQTP